MSDIQNTSFGKELKKLLAAQKITVASLSDQLGFQSRTSLYRIVTDTSSPDQAEALLKKLLEKPVLRLTPEDVQRLRECIQIRRIGAEEYASMQAMEKLLRPQVGPIGEFNVFYLRENGTEQEMTLHELLHDLQQRPVTRAKVVLMGQLQDEMVQALYDAIAICRNWKIEILHYISSEGSAFIRNLAAALPLLYLGNYDALCYDTRNMPPELVTLLEQPRQLITLEMADGQERFFLSQSFDRDTILLAESHQAQQNLDLWILRRFAPQMHPLKTHFSATGTPEDYLRFTRQCLSLENNSEIFMFRGDVPLSAVPGDIALRAACDGFVEAGLCQSDDANTLKLMNRFYEVHKLRFENLTKKRKVTHIVFDRRAMLSFARTGKTRDHFFAMRPYTPQERVTILTTLLEQTANNPFFTIYFLKDEQSEITGEVTCFDDRRLMLVRGDTSYHIEQDGHAEALISQRKLCIRYRQFFLEKILKSYVVSAAETKSMLSYLIAEARRW